MKGFGEKKMNRLLGLLLTLALLLTAVPASAQLIGDWENVSVNIFWFDDAANTQMVQAWPVPEDQVQHGYWVTLPAEALGKTIQLMITYPDYGYFFYFNNGTSETQWLLEDNAQDLSDEYAMYIGYSYNGVPQVTQIPDFIKLYASTLQPPFEVEELMGAETFVPGATLVVPEPPQGGAELLLPDMPHGGGAELTGPGQTPAQTTLLVEYYHEDGWLIDSQTKTLGPGEHWIYPESRLTDAYELLGDDYAVVYVDNSGYTRTASIAFQYRNAEESLVELLPPQVTEPQFVLPQQATITVKYVDSRTYEAIAPDQTVTLPGDGTHTIQPDPAVIPTGYTPFAGTDVVQVIVRNGQATQPSVSFYFQKTAGTAAPVRTFDVTIYYYDSEGREIAPRGTMTLQPGVHRIEAPASILNNGFELMSDAVFDLTVYEDGTYDRAAEDVGFWYRPAVKLPTTAKVSVRYLNEISQEIAASHEVELAVGKTHTVRPDVLRVPTAYDASSAGAVQVTVSAEGHASPAVVNFVFDLRREGQNVPAGQRIERYGIANAKVRFRTEPYTTSNRTIIREIPKGSAVYMLANEYNTKGEMWTRVIINNEQGYIQTMYIDMLTQEASDLHALLAGATPVPTFTPVPTPSPTPEPTESLVELVTPVPVTPTPATSYAVTSRSTELRTGTGSADNTKRWLQQDELVTVVGTYYDAQTQSFWCGVRTLDGLFGYVQQSALFGVTAEQAALYQESAQQRQPTPAPTELITNTPVPEQRQGYGYMLYDDALLRRMPSEYAQILAQLDAGEVVYIAGQQYVSGVKWHYVDRNGQWGYIRGDFVQTMTDTESDAYFDLYNTTPVPTPTLPPATRPAEQTSSYGYVTGNGVNLRSAASTSSRTLGSLNRYALCMVEGVETVNGQKWYRVVYERTEGYVFGQYLKQMTQSELVQFMSSDEYQQGLLNNGAQQNGGNTGVAGPGGMESGEDQVLDSWYQSGNGTVRITPAPFVPVATPEPLVTATPTPKPTVGYWGSYLPAETPVATGGAGLGESSSDLPLPGENGGVVAPPDGNADGSAPQGAAASGSPITAVVVVALLVAVSAGVIMIIQHQRKRRRIAMRAAQRRAQQARNGGGAARLAGTQNRTGTYFPQQPPVYPQRNPQPAQAQPPVQFAPLPTYNGSNASQQQTQQPTGIPQRPYARQSGAGGNAGGVQTSQQSVQQPRVGRRTAYQQALAAQQNQNHQNP